MVENVGSMEITYSVTVNQALRNLDKLNSKMGETTEKTKEQTEADKAKKVSLKQAAKAWAVMGAVATGALYAIIKASSYAAIYTAQFGATVQQLANVFMERTGVNKAIEDFNREFQVFADNITSGDTLVQALLKSLKVFGEWFGKQTSLIQFLVLLTGLFTAIGIIVGALGALGIASAAISSGWVVLVGTAAFLVAKFVAVKAAISGIVVWFAAGSTAALAIAAAIGVMIGLITVWLMKKAGILDWFASLGEGFRNWESWIKDIILIITSPLLLLGAAIVDIVNGDFGFPLLKKGLTDVGDAFGRWEKRILGVIGTIINKVKTLINWIKNIPSIFGGAGGGGTSISPSSSSGGKYRTGVHDAIIAPGGNIITTDPKDFLIATKKPGELMGNGDTYNIAPIINITTSGGSGLAGDISRQVSKAIAEEVRRITKV